MRGPVRSAVLGFLLVAFPASSAAVSGPSRLTPRKWREDIAQLVRLVEENHPNPYTRIPRGRFDAARRSLEREIPRLSDTQVVARLMRLVGSLRDGHTVLHPVDPNGFNTWFPLSLYRFADGLYVVSADERYRGLPGRKVVTVGDLPADEACERAADLLGSDNETGRRWSTFFLSSGEALAALRVIPSADRLSLETVDSGGSRKTWTIEGVRLPYGLEHRFWGEMYPPGPRERPARVRLGFEDGLLDEWRRRPVSEQTHLPLHLRSRRAYWHAYLPERKALYIHMTHVTDEGRGEFASFEEFQETVFREAEAREVEIVILDIRYNSGGDGSVLIPFVHRFACSPRLNRPGRLFTLTGRKTYSAGVMLVDLMLDHTKTLLVGEPSGAPLRSFGDAATFRLAHSGLRLEVSTVEWALSSSADKRLVHPVDIPAVFTGADYFSGRDPAVDLLLALEGPYRSLPEILLENGGEAARAEYERRAGAYGRTPWWAAFDEGAMRRTARALAKEGRLQDGLDGFRMLVDRFSGSWRAWRDFGRALHDSGDEEGALRCYRKGLEVNPGSEELSRAVRGE